MKQRHLNFGKPDAPEIGISLADMERYHRSIDVVKSLAESDGALDLLQGDPDPGPVDPAELAKLIPPVKGF